VSQRQLSCTLAQGREEGEEDALPAHLVELARSLLGLALVAAQQRLLRLELALELLELPRVERRRLCRLAFEGRHPALEVALLAADGGELVVLVVELAAERGEVGIVRRGGGGGGGREVRG